MKTSVLRLIPNLEIYLIIKKLNKKFPGRTIKTHRIANSVKLGKKCGVYYDVELGNGVSIGDYSYVNDRSVIGSGKVGKFCSIGYNCQIGMPEHPLDFISTSPFTYGINNVFNFNPTWNDFNNPPIIGNDVWIGSNSVVLQGVTIGDGAVIAAGSIVTKDVEPYSVVGGVPAKQIKKRFSEEKIKALLELQWWNKSEDDLKMYSKLFHSKDDWHKNI
ncbi:CatB-related O-acetyltransferase [Peribacillus simplex]|uniref:CatB-related O-acetyltransferase n=1 Tax=Peribacillus simplex TaxID=1478 RepID=UPI0025B67361|nr:CatB-related O-acetyltransferase [Peribacillus simplex]